MEKKKKYEWSKKLLKQFDNVVQHYCTATSAGGTMFAAGCMYFEYHGPDRYTFKYGPARILIGEKKAGKLELIADDDKNIDFMYEVALELANFWNEMVGAVIRYDCVLISEEKELEDRITKNSMEELARERDECAVREREVETQIFDEDRAWSKMEMNDILKCYHEIKIDRAKLSEQFAKMFMSATPRERLIFSNGWFETDEGKRKLRDLL